MKNQTLRAALCSAGLMLSLSNGALAQTAAPTATSQTPDFLARAAAEKGALVKPSGLVFLSTKEGSGASPKASDTVKVHYRGQLADGKEFDSSFKRGEPAVFPLDGVIRCWTEGVQLIKVGGKAKLTCPAAIAYGNRSVGGGLIPAGSVLQFEIELLDIAR